MPELPEVENYRKYVEGTSLNQKILKIEVDDPRLTKPSAQAVERGVVGKSFQSTSRIGKYLFLKITGSNSLLMHFGLTGNVHYFKDEADIPRYTRVLFYFDNGFKLAYICKRKFGWVEVIPGEKEYQQSMKLGEDAGRIGWDEFFKKIRRRKSLIKPILMDQKLTAGIGNWIADEILYQSKLHPESTVEKLTDEDLRLLFDKMKHVIEVALKHEANFDRFPDYFMIHNRKKGGICFHTGDQLEKLVVGGRGTFISPKWQERKV